MRLIDADLLFDVVQKDKHELNIHKNNIAAMVHNGEYDHFMKRIMEQPEIHMSISVCCPNGEIVKNIHL